MEWRKSPIPNTFGFGTPPSTCMPANKATRPRSARDIIMFRLLFSFIPIFFPLLLCFVLENGEEAAEGEEDMWRKRSLFIYIEVRDKRRRVHGKRSRE